MILYHFCCERDMRGIRSNGITKGVIFGEQQVKQPDKGGKWVWCAIPGWQWLTLDKERNHQSWATKHLIRYDRTEYRWTVEIPEKEEGSLYNRARLMELYPGVERLFDGWDGSGSWRVYRGYIPRMWLKKLEHWNKATGQWEEVPYGR